MEILIFELGTTRIGLRCTDVRELHRAVALVALPKAPPIVEGIINLRGRIVPVLDIRARFRLAPNAPSHTDHLILAFAGERLVALRVDRALDVVRVDPQQLEGSEATWKGVAYVAGVAKLRDGLVLIHDLATFLDAAEHETLSDAVSAMELGGSR